MRGLLERGDRIVRDRIRLTLLIHDLAKVRDSILKLVLLLLNALERALILVEHQGRTLLLLFPVLESRDREAGLFLETDLIVREFEELHNVVPHVDGVTAVFALSLDTHHVSSQWVGLH